MTNSQPRVRVMHQDYLCRFAEDQVRDLHIVGYRIDRGERGVIDMGGDRRTRVVWLTCDGLPPPGLHPGQFGYRMPVEDCHNPCPVAAAEYARILGAGRA